MVYRGSELDKIPQVLLHEKGERKNWGGVLARINLHEFPNHQGQGFRDCRVVWSRCSPVSYVSESR